MSGDDIRRQLVVEKGDAIAQNQLALLESLQLKLVRRADRLQGGYGRIEVPVFLPQPLELLLDSCA